MTCISFSLFPCKLGLLLVAITAHEAVGQCSFKVVDATDATPSKKWADPTIVHNAFAVKPEYGDLEFLKEVLGDVTFNVVPPEFRNRTVISDGHPSPAIALSFNDWLTAINKPAPQVPTYLFDWCYEDCTRALARFPQPPSYLLPSGRIFAHFFAIGKPGEGLSPHMHGASWVMQLSGTKKWIVQDKSGANMWEDDPPNIECVQKPGDVVYIPGNTAHATIQESWSVSMGGQDRNAAQSPEYEDTGLIWEVVTSNVSAIAGKLPLLSQGQKKQVAFEAAASGHAQVLETVMSNDSREDSPMYAEVFAQSLMQGHSQVLSHLLRGKTQEEVQGKLAREATSFASAITKNKKKAVSLLMEARADITAADTQRAVMAGHAGMLDLFLSRGVSKKDLGKVIKTLKKTESGLQLKFGFPRLHQEMMQTLKKALKEKTQVTTV